MLASNRIELAPLPMPVLASAMTEMGMWKFDHYRYMSRAELIDAIARLMTNRDRMAWRLALGLEDFPEE